MSRRTPPSPPPALAIMQEEFGRAIRMPFDFSTGRFRCRKEAYPEGIAASMVPRGALGGRDRLAVYNEQYWYRLLTVLQKDFPLLAATLGFWDFNKLATAFLDRQPSRSPYLQDLPRGLAEYLGTDPAYATSRNRQIADLDMAFLAAFHAPSEEPLDPGGLSPRESERLDAVPMGFQPWLSLLEEDWNLMECRRGLLEKTMDKPRFREQKGYWAVFRHGETVEWKPLNPVQYRLLDILRSGLPLGAACESLSSHLEAKDMEILMRGISPWFADWTRLKWFRRPSFEGLV